MTGLHRIHRHSAAEDPMPVHWSQGAHSPRRVHLHTHTPLKRGGRRGVQSRVEIVRYPRCHAARRSGTWQHCVDNCARPLAVLGHLSSSRHVYHTLDYRVFTARPFLRGRGAVADTLDGSARQLGHGVRNLGSHEPRLPKTNRKNKEAARREPCF